MNPNFPSLCSHTLTTGRGSPTPGARKPATYRAEKNCVRATSVNPTWNGMLPTYRRRLLLIIAAGRGACTGTNDGGARAGMRGGVRATRGTRPLEPPEDGEPAYAPRWRLRRSGDSVGDRWRTRGMEWSNASACLWGGGAPDSFV